LPPSLLYAMTVDVPQATVGPAKVEIPGKIDHGFRLPFLYGSNKLSAVGS
jgi:hypothetical protein